MTGQVLDTVDVLKADELVARFRSTLANDRMGASADDAVAGDYRAAEKACELAIRDARERLRELKAIKAHRCDFPTYEDAGGYYGKCAVCGADGNA